MSKRFYSWLAWKLPRLLVYWCFIRVVVYAYSVIEPQAEMGTLSHQDIARMWDA